MSRRLENLIASVAPGWAAARAANRLRLNFSEQKAEAIAEMFAMAAHDSAEYSRVTADWNTRLLSSDQAVIADQPTAIARSRDAIRNDGTAGSIVDAHVRHTVGIGITPRANARHPRTGVQLLEFNHAADRVWYQWARDKNLCHTERHWNFTGLESLTVREEVTTGVSFAIFNYTPRVNDIGTHIQIVEFEQLVAWLVKNPDTGFWIRNGVEIDDFGAPAALWVFTKGHPLEYIQGRMAYTRIPWDRVLCSMRPERVRQSQGMGRLSPVLQPLHHNKLYELYSVVRAKIECIAGASIESDHDALPPGPGQDLFGGAGTNGPGGPYMREKDISLQPGMIVPLAPGRTMKFHEPTTPGSQYQPFTRTQITKIAAGAGLDYPTVARDFTGMTYSGQLQGRLETWAETDPAQLRLVDDFCRPIRDKVITMAILEGRLEAPGFDNPEWRAAYLEAEWRGPKKGSINPANDRAADKIALDYKLTTRRDILNEENLDVREVVSQLSDEYRMGQEQDPPVNFPDAQPDPAVSPNEPRPGAQDDRQKKGLALAANVGELLDRIEHLTRENVALAAGWDESKHPRVPKGEAGGGEFGEGGKGASEKSAEHGGATTATEEKAKTADDPAMEKAKRGAQARKADKERQSRIAAWHEKHPGENRTKAVADAVKAGEMVPYEVASDALSKDVNSPHADTLREHLEYLNGREGEWKPGDWGDVQDYVAKCKEQGITPEKIRHQIAFDETTVKQLKAQGTLTPHARGAIEGIEEANRIRREALDIIEKKPDAQGPAPTQPAAAPGYSEHTAAKADLTEKIKAAMDAGDKEKAKALLDEYQKLDRPAVAPEPQSVEALPPGQSGGGEFAGTSISTPESVQGSQGRHMTGDEIRAYAAKHGLTTTRARRALALGLEEEARQYAALHPARGKRSGSSRYFPGKWTSAEDRMLGRDYNPE